MGEESEKERVLLGGGVVWTETQGQYQLRTNTSAPQSSVLVLALAVTHNELVSSARFIWLYSHKLIALRDLICVGMSQKNKNKQSLGAQWRTGLGVKGWRVLRISSRQNESFM